MTLEKAKNEVALKKGYPNWEEMTAWYIDKNFTQNAVILVEGAMNEAAELYAAYRTDKMISAENYCKVVFALQEKVKELEHELKKKVIQ